MQDDEEVHARIGRAATSVNICFWSFSNSYTVEFAGFAQPLWVIAAGHFLALEKLCPTLVLPAMPMVKHTTMSEKAI